ncbi:MAG: sodium/solute symporter [Kiritimatiellae bacterium]|nr:sodium/solute symporter [Kiritimatiellia bacterium]
MKRIKHLVVAIAAAALSFAGVAGDEQNTPVLIDWVQGGETFPSATGVARPFGGFLPDGRFVVAGGTFFDSGEKKFAGDIFVRSANGEWSRNDSLLPEAAGEGVSCTTEKGLFCAGGRNEGGNIRKAFVFDGAAIAELPDLPEDVVMGSAAADGNKVFVQTGAKVYTIDIGAKKEPKWELFGTLPDGIERAQAVAAVQNGDQKYKYLIILGGINGANAPLANGWRYALGEEPSQGWKEVALPEGVTTIGAAFLPSGHQHVLLIGGFGLEGWKARIAGSQETDPVALGWQRGVWAYNAVTGAWCEYGTLAEGDFPRCGAAAGLKNGKTPEMTQIIIAGGEERPGVRTAKVSSARFLKIGKFGATAWIVVGVYACLMVGMACFFIFKKKDENDYFRGGNRIPWYVAGMSIFATMLSSITFIAIPTQAYLQDWRYFIMAFFIIGMAPVAIYYYLPFFCRLGITSAYEYLEKRFNLGVRLFGSAAFVVFMVCRVAVVTLLPAIALNAVTGVSIDACILICGILTMIYCSLGGLEAVIWSDFVQGIVLMGGAVSVLALLIAKTGPDGAHFSTFWTVASEGGKNTMWDFRFLMTQPVFWVVAVQGLISNLSSYTSDQCVIQRYIATPDENATKRSLWFNGCMSVFAQIVFYGIGMALFAFYKTNPAAMDVTMPKGDSVMPIFMATEMPAWLAGLVIAAVFAATISTLSANLSSASTAIVTDFIKRFKPSIPGKAQIRCGQVCTYVVGVIGIMAALTLAHMESNALFDNFNKYIAMLTAGLTGLFFMGVFIPRIKGIAAVLGLAANYFVCFGCEILHCNVFGLKFHPFLLGGIGLVVCVLVAYIASFIFTRDGKDLSGLTLKTLAKKD